MEKTRVLMVCIIALYASGCQTTGQSPAEQPEQKQQPEQPQPQQKQAQGESQAGAPAGEEPSASKEPSANKEQSSAEPNQQQKETAVIDKAKEAEVLSQALSAFDQAARKPSAETPPSSETTGQADEGMSTASAQNQGATAPIPAGAQTKSEKIADLDRQLDSSYADFDGIILREREYIKAKENARGSATENLEDDKASLANKSTRMGGDQSEQKTDTDSGGRSAVIDGGQQPYVASAVSVPPPDIPSGTDDDVVARQLREAALKEPDPELREKLWDEYRKYKKLPPRQK